MNNCKELAELIDQTRRADGFVCATFWCDKYGRKLNRFTSLASIKQLDVEVAEHLGIDAAIDARQGLGTYVHPLVFFELARWLDFDLYYQLLSVSEHHFFGRDCRES